MKRPSSTKERVEIPLNITDYDIKGTSIDDIIAKLEPELKRQLKDYLALNEGIEDEDKIYSLSSRFVIWPKGV